MSHELVLDQQAPSLSPSSPHAARARLSKTLAAGTVRGLYYGGLLLKTSAALIVGVSSASGQQREPLSRQSVLTDVMGMLEVRFSAGYASSSELTFGRSLKLHPGCRSLGCLRRICS